jgi:hypothetical protein
MIARRLATVAVAAAMIVGAFLIRRNVIEGDDGDGDPAPPPVEEASELVCLTELEDVCAELAATRPDLDVTVEDAGITLDRLAEGDPVPLWLTFEPFPAMAGTLLAGDVLAASELAIGTSSDRQTVLDARCGTEPLWRCIGDLAGEEWGDVPGRVEPSVGDAGNSAAALASFAAAVAGYFGTVELNSNVWASDLQFLPWVQGLVREVPLGNLTSGTPAATMIVRDSAVNVAATNDAEIALLAAPPEDLTPSYPEPSMWLQAVLAAPEGADVPDDLAQDAADALLAAGWDPAAAATTPLPSATTMIALRQLWEDAQ